MRAALDYKLFKEDSIVGAKDHHQRYGCSEKYAAGEVEDAIRIVEKKPTTTPTLFGERYLSRKMEDEIKVIKFIATGRLKQSSCHDVASASRRDSTSAVGMSPICRCRTEKRQGR